MRTRKQRIGRAISKIGLSFLDLGFFNLGMALFDFGSRMERTTSNE